MNACLSRAGRVGKCDKIEKDLRGVSKAEGVDSCVDETVALMRCTAGASRANGCSSQFLAMRECNRASGNQLVSDGGAHAIAPGAVALFTPPASVTAVRRHRFVLCRACRMLAMILVHPLEFQLVVWLSDALIASASSRAVQRLAC